MGIQKKKKKSHSNEKFQIKCYYKDTIVPPKNFGKTDLLLPEVIQCMCIQINTYDIVIIYVTIVRLQPLSHVVEI